MTAQAKNFQFFKSPINKQQAIEIAKKFGSGGSVAWGDITGTLSDQEDLQNALNAKEDDTTTINDVFVGDGSTSQFSLTHAPILESLRVFLNGQLLIKGDSEGQDDYYLSSESSISLTNTPVVGEEITVIYNY